MLGRPQSLSHLLQNVALAAPDWWDGMSTPEKFASIGGVAGIVSVLVSLYIGIESRRFARKQLDIAFSANETTRLAVVDQVEMNRIAKSASIRLAKARAMDMRIASVMGELDFIEKIYKENAPKDLAVIKLTFINEGQSPAYKLILRPYSYYESNLAIHHRGYSLGEPEMPFASWPNAEFLSVPPGQTVDFRVVMRVRMDWVGFYGEYQVIYDDGLGTHEAIFAFNIQGAGRTPDTTGPVWKVDVASTSTRDSLVP